MPSGSIEIAQTSRYSRITGKNELCILATRAMPVNFLITELKGSLAELTDEEDRELKRSDSRSGGDGGMRRDFSVIHSKQLKKNHLFLGPARFVNVCYMRHISFLSRGNVLSACLPAYSMIVTTTASFFAMGGTSPSGRSNLSLWDRS